MESSKKCLVLLSGGVDSAVVLWWAKKRGWKLATLSFLFSGRRKKEIASAKKLRVLAGCRENVEVSLPFITSPKSELSCHIPKRNLMFYGIGASLAEKIKADFILGGHTRADGKVFPDARKSYLSQLNRLVQLEQKAKRSVRLLFPFIQSSKKDIIETGSSLNVPFHFTWSCSVDGGKHCWKCNSCKERISGFLAAKVDDPLFKRE